MNKIFKVMWNAKKGCNVVTSEKAKGTCRFQGASKAAVAALLGATITAGFGATGDVDAASYTTVGTITVDTTGNQTFDTNEGNLTTDA
ncbi:MAG: hypothetical protein HUJ85_03770, partial [Veillonella sp.]|nr:hypothetical protein [Veillonella sp.]